MILSLRCDNPKTSTASRLGLNIFYFVRNNNGKGVAKNKYVANVRDILPEINKVKECIIKNDIDVIDSLCSGGMFKPLTLLSGLHPYKTNVNDRGIINILNDESKRSALIQRLDMISCVLMYA